jgi:hypothetical protein
VYTGLENLWLGNCWIRGELGVTFGKEEVLGSIPVGGDCHHDVYMEGTS